MTAYERVKAARAKDRASAVNYINNIFTHFLEMRGDRRFADDRAVVAGIALLYDMPVTVVGIEKGRNTKERIERNFGSAHPEGYRKALYQMKKAEKFGRPVVCLIDTAGAFCGIGAEERGQGQAIADCLQEMSTLRTPVISILIGEGGSGGALALAVADEVWMLENAVYSVISPEGCASILWKDPSKAEKAARCLKLTVTDLYRMKVVEKALSEAKGQEALYRGIKDKLYDSLGRLQNADKDELIENRYRKFRKIGAGTE